MYIFLSILIAVVSVLLIFVVMIQESKGGGLAAGFSSANNIVGVRRATNGVERLTWILAGILVFLCIIIAHWSSFGETAGSGAPESVITDYVDRATIPAATDAQPFGDATNAPAQNEETPAQNEETPAQETPNTPAE